jgi:hypothetical protein
MITFIDLGPMATVHLFLRVPRPLQAGGWSWGELPGMAGVLAKEFAYTAGECTSLVHTYGRNMTRMLAQGQLGDRFTIVAKGPKTGLTLGMREWEWSTELRDYRRAGEYLCGWREAVKALYLQTGELFTDCRFEARPAGLPVVANLLSGIPVQRMSRVAA